METFTFVPSAGSSGVMHPRTLKAQFGDGYAQRVKDGVNARLRFWNLQFDPMHATTPIGGSGANLDDINDFLERQDGYIHFLWVQLPPFNTEGAKEFVCEEWSFTYDRGLRVGLNAVFLQQAL